MKKFVLAAVAAALLPTSVLAADLPSRRAPPVFVPPPLPVFSWTGFYIGANAGYAFDGRHNYALVPNNAIATAALGLGQTTPGFGTRKGGFTGGGQIGYNYQIGNILGFGGGGVVIGVEADAAYTDLRQGVISSAADLIPRFAVAPTTSGQPADVSATRSTIFSSTGRAALPMAASATAWRSVQSQRASFKSPEIAARSAPDTPTAAV